MDRPRTNRIAAVGDVFSGQAWFWQVQPAGRYSPGVICCRTARGAIAPMAPIETRPETAKKKNKALQLDSAKAKTGSTTPTTSSGTPRQPPFWISPTRVVRLKSMRLEKKASKVARV